MTIKARIAAFVASWTGRVIIAALLIGLVWFIAAKLVGGSTAKVEADLNSERAGAAIESGADAANTVGDVGANADATDRITRENDNAIRNADGAEAPVAPDVGRAGRDSLCRRAAYRDKPECLQQSPAR